MCNKVDNHCREEKLGCEGCKYNKEIAKIDMTYCTNGSCETKEECDRYMGHYKFERENFDRYCFMSKCEEYQG